MARRESPEIKKLRSNLRSPGVRRDDGRWQLEAVQRVISLGTSGCDMSPLFPEMIMAGATTNLVQKKLVYLYLTMYAESNSELVLLTVNTLHKDCQDSNPVIRGLALRALTSLKVVSVLQLMLECVETGLRDPSALVRRTAVMAVLKLFHLDQQLVLKNNLVTVLYQLLKDIDPQVVSNTLCVLTEVLAGEGGLVVTTGLAHHLLNRLSEFNEWSSCLVLRFLRAYQPSSEQELLDVLNVLDSRLSHSNSGLVLETVALFLHLTTHHPTLERDVHHRIKAPLLTLLGTQCPELTYTCLQHIQLLVRDRRYLWSKDYKNFFCSPCWAENCTGIFYDHRPSLKECAKRSGTADKNNLYYFQDHITAGLSRGNQCFEPVEENSVRCYKWILGDLCHPIPSTRLFLRSRNAVTENQDLITDTSGSVTFRSPGFYSDSKRKRRYFNSMLCLYNISVPNCINNSVVIRSTSDDHSLFDDERDYLYFDFGQVTTTVTGDSVGSFSESIPTSSFYAVLWTDSTPGTDVGKFEIEATCNKKNNDSYDIY